MTCENLTSTSRGNFVRSIYRTETTEQTEKLPLLYSIAFHID